MPTFRHGKKTAILLNSYNLSSYLNSANVNIGLDTNETTTFGVDAKTYIAGLEAGTISLGGLFEGTENDVDLNTALNNEASTPVTVCQEGLTFTAGGTRCLIANAKVKSYEIKSAVADVISATAELEADGGIDAAIILRAGGTVAGGATDNGTSVDNTAVSTTNGYSINLHITANTQSATTGFVVQDSANNSTWNTLATLTSSTAGTNSSQRLVATTGTVLRYVRVVATGAAGTGSLTYSLAFSRR